MYQVTAIYQNGELAYGEGEGLAHAIEECMQDIDPMCEFMLPETYLRVVCDSRIPVTMSIDAARAFILR